MKKLSTVVTAAVLCAVLALSACSGSNPASEESKPASQTSVSSQADTSAGENSHQIVAESNTKEDDTEASSTPESSVQTSTVEVVTITEADCVGTWKLSVDPGKLKDLIPAFQSMTPVATLPGSTAALEDEKLTEFMSRLLNQAAFRMDTDKKVYFRFDVTTMLSALSDMEMQIFDSFKNMSVEEAAAALGTPDSAEDLKKMLEEQNLTWEEYIDSQKAQLEAGMKMLSNMDPEQIAANIFGGEAKLAEDGAAELEFGTMTLENGRIRLEPTTSSTGTTFILAPVSTSTLIVEDILLPDNGRSSEDNQKMIDAMKGIQLVKS